MKFTKLETQEQFDNLKKGDLLLVSWKHQDITPGWFDYINHDNEVIIDRKRNIFFSIKLFLAGESYAKEVYLIEGDDDEIL